LGCGQITVMFWLLFIHSLYTLCHQLSSATHSSNSPFSDSVQAASAKTNILSLLRPSVCWFNIRSSLVLSRKNGARLLFRADSKNGFKSTTTRLPFLTFSSKSAIINDILEVCHLLVLSRAPTDA